MLLLPTFGICCMRNGPGTNEKFGQSECSVAKHMLVQSTSFHVWPRGGHLLIRADRAKPLVHCTPLFLLQVSSPHQLNSLSSALIYLAQHNSDSPFLSNMPPCLVPSSSFKGPDAGPWPNRLGILFFRAWIVDVRAPFWGGCVFCS